MSGKRTVFFISKRKLFRENVTRYKLKTVIIQKKIMVQTLPALGRAVGGYGVKETTGELRISSEAPSC